MIEVVAANAFDPVDADHDSTLFPLPLTVGPLAAGDWLFHHLTVMRFAAAGAAGKLTCSVAPVPELST